MADFKVTSERFVPGETVSAYAQSNWLRHELPPTGAPKGASVSSAVVQADGSATLTGLVDGVAYFAHAPTPDRYVPFRTVAARQGKAQFNGTGAQTAFVIQHGLGFVPTFVEVGAGSTDAKGDNFWTADATSITVTFGTAPAVGTNNVVLWWRVA